jgi:hypothetical protein
MAYKFARGGRVGLCSLPTTIIISKPAPLDASDRSPRSSQTGYTPVQVVISTELRLKPLRPVPPNGIQGRMTGPMSRWRLIQGAISVPGCCSSRQYDAADLMPMRGRLFCLAVVLLSGQQCSARRDAKGIEQVRVPAGTFLRGRTTRRSPNQGALPLARVMKRLDSEKPQHSVRLTKATGSTNTK